VVAGHLPEFLDGTAPCQLQPGFDGDRLRFRQRGLQPVANLRPVVDAVPELYRRKFRLHGRRIKMMRTLVLVKQAGREFLKLLHPAAINPLKIGGQVVANTIVFRSGFIFLYFMSIATLTFVLLISGLDFISSFSAVIACINNAGPGLGVVGPASNFGVLTDFQTWCVRCDANRAFGDLHRADIVHSAILAAINIELKHLFAVASELGRAFLRLGLARIHFYYFYGAQRE